MTVIISKTLYRTSRYMHNLRHLSSIHFPTYVHQMKERLKPPVSNIVMFRGKQLIVMLVKGPNQRSDYHLNQGEELFYQYLGSIDVDIKDPDVQLHKKVRINEDEMFLLSKGLPHSPQRYENTIGIVFERERNLGEYDGLRWYVPSSDTTLYESFFHCADLGTQIKTEIEKYHNSSEYLTETPTPIELIPESQREHKQTMAIVRGNAPKVNEPFALNSLLGRSGNQSGLVSIVDSEFKVDVLVGSTTADIKFIKDSDIFVWQKYGESIVLVESNQRSGLTHKLTSNVMSLFSNCKSLSLSQSSNESIAIIVQNNGVAK